MKNDTPIHMLPIQVKALTPGRLDPEIWKCNTIHECVERARRKVKKFKKDSTQWEINFTDHTAIAGVFLA